MKGYQVRVQVVEVDYDTDSQGDPMVRSATPLPGAEVWLPIFKESDQAITHCLALADWSEEAYWADNPEGGE